MMRPMSVALTLTVAAIVAPRAVSVAVAGGRRGRRATEQAVYHRAVPGHDDVSGPSFSPDGSKVLFTSDASGIPNAYAVPVAGGPSTARDPFDDRIDLRSPTSPRTTACSTLTTGVATSTTTSTCSPGWREPT